MDRGQADIIVADLARQTGIAGLALDADGFGFLAFDDRAVVGLGYNQAAGALDLMTCLDQVEPSPARRLAALRGNFGWGAAGGETLATDPSSGAFILQRRYVGQDLVESGGLAGAVEGLLAQAERWTRRLRSIPDIATTSAERPDDAPAASGGIRA